MIPLVLAAPIAEVATPTTPATLQPPPAQPPARAANVLFAEVLGSGLFYSLNYERLFHKVHVGLRAGASFFTYGVSQYDRSGNLTLLTFPLVASYYLGWRQHNLQLGLGATLLYTGVASDSQGTKFESERSGFGVAATAVVGYRYLPRGRGVTFGVGFTPLLRASSFLPWGGANVGYVF